MRKLIATSILALSVSAPAFAQVPTIDKNAASSLLRIDQTLTKIYALQAQAYALLAERSQTSSQSVPSCYYASQPYSVGSALNGQICGYSDDGIPGSAVRQHDKPPVWRLPIQGEK